MKMKKNIKRNKRKRKKNKLKGKPAREETQDLRILFLIGRGTSNPCLRLVKNRMPWINDVVAPCDGSASLLLLAG
jgi:hypothetical protein